MDYKIIFVDIDWTILDHQIHDWDYESLDVLKEAQNKGVLVYLCTARPYDSIMHTGLFNLFTPDGTICTNGGVAFIKDELLFANIIPEETVRQIEKICNKHHLVLELSTDKERHFTNKANTYVHRYFSIFTEVMPVIKKYSNKNISQILLFAPEKYDKVLKKEFPSNMNLFRFDSCGVDVGMHNNTKGKAVKKVLKHLNIDKKYTIGIGDSFDDISMFKEVGLSIAMGNGSEEAKENASLVAPSISDHGVALTLKSLLNK